MNVKIILESISKLNLDELITVKEAVDNAVIKVGTEMVVLRPIKKDIVTGDNFEDVIVNAIQEGGLKRLFLGFAEEFPSDKFLLTVASECDSVAAGKAFPFLDERKSPREGIGLVEFMRDNPVGIYMPPSNSKGPGPDIVYFCNSAVIVIGTKASFTPYKTKGTKGWTQKGYMSQTKQRENNFSLIPNYFYSKKQFVETGEKTKSGKVKKQVVPVPKDTELARTRRSHIALSFFDKSKELKERRKYFAINIVLPCEELLEEDEDGHKSHIEAGLYDYEINEIQVSDGGEYLNLSYELARIDINQHNYSTCRLFEGSILHGIQTCIIEKPTLS